MSPKLQYAYKCERDASRDCDFRGRRKEEWNKNKKKTRRQAKDDENNTAKKQINLL